jgi:hypothetical protein
VNNASFYRLNSAAIRSRALSSLSLLLQLRLRVSASASFVAILIISTLVAYGQSQPPGFKELQIRALITSDIAGLNGWTVKSQTEKFAVEWTLLAAQYIKKMNGLMMKDGAALLSDFIYEGASRYVGEGAPAARADEAQRHLLSFLETLFKTNNRVEAIYIDRVGVQNIELSLCPIWPFC